MQALGVMFHHFHGGTHPPVQGSISADDLRAMIRWIGPGRILPARDWLSRAEEGVLEIDDWCLTFDDNLKCQYDVALPVLREFDLTAFWFIPTATLTNEPPKLEIYRTFRTTAFDEIEDFYGEFFRALAASDDAAEIETQLERFDPSSYLCEFPFYSEADRRFRFVRDEVLGPQRYERVMDELMAAHGVRGADLAPRLWMNARQIRELHEAGHVIGMHSHSHPTRMAHLYPEAQMRDYRENYNILCQITGCPPRTVSHPCNSYNSETLDVLRRLGATVGFRADSTLEAFSELEYPRADHAWIAQEMRRCESPFSPATSLATWR
ncbi:MAG: polysaccharide deacetylase family protein [Planctomycetota bacterium]|nr:MAG: polysaccharide deacetylase family protein [Planctomycetota bacterium]